MTLARRMFFASVVLALIVAAAFGALIFAVSAQRDATKRETRSREVTGEVLRVEKLVVDMETGVRGLIISNNNRAYLDPYRTAQQEIPAHLRTLDALIAGDPEQQDRASTLRQRIDEYKEFVAIVIGLVEEEPAIARSEIYLEAGKAYTDEIRGDRRRLPHCRE